MTDLSSASVNDAVIVSAAHRDDPFVIRTPGQIVVFGNLCQIDARGYRLFVIERNQPQILPSGRRKYPISLCAPGDVINPLAMNPKTAKLLARFRVPYPRRLVLAAGEKPGAVQTPCQCSREVTRAVQTINHLSLSVVNNDSWPVIGNQSLSIRTPAHAGERLPILILVYHEDSLPSLRVPDAAPAETKTGSQPNAVRMPVQDSNKG